jgi:glycosyltransferase involved in cell wall biosynthesis
VRPPVVLDDWPVTPADDPNRFTTIGSWRGPYGPVEHEGRTYGLKVHEFRKVLELPERAPLTFEIALDIHPADARDRDALLAHKWRLVDPRSVASDPSSFRQYVQQSGGEFSVAQGIYVDTSSGWFSDRTVRYLASGKPVLVQDTGWGGGEPPREGIVGFGTLEEAVEGARRIDQAYEAHSEAARALAEEHFDSDKVLVRFLEEAGVGTQV